MNRQRSWPARARSLERELRNAPGRRIEVAELTGDDLPHNDTGVWTWRGSRLVAAGSPTGQFRPAARSGRTGADVVRGLVDWEGELRRAPDVRILESVVEAALVETRSLFEGGHNGVVTEAHAVSFGRAAGARLWRLALESARARMEAARRRDASAPITNADLSAADLGEESHYRPLRHMDGLMRQLGRDARVQEVGRLFGLAADEFLLAGRGIASIDFERTSAERRDAGVPASARLSRVLLTGFDPFEGRRVEPSAGRFNPSGAAILQLDGTMIGVDQSRAASVEGVILPVHFGEFRAGIVESRLGPRLREANAVITVSESRRIAPTNPVRVERFAVGVHRLNNDRLEAVPPPPGGAEVGPAIIETGGAGIDVTEVAREAGTNLPRGQAPTLRADILFRFPDAPAADRALSALGLPQQGAADVQIADVTAIRQIVRTMERGAQSPGITFEASGETFHAVILEGPGGDFLSNEVSYRVLRFLAEENPDAASFHVHTPRGTAERSGHIRQDVTGREEARAGAAEAGRPTTTESAAARTRARQERFSGIETGRDVVRRVVAALTELIKAVVRRLP